MSKESIMEIVDQALLKTLNPDYQSESQEPLACVWIDIATNIPPEIEVSQGTREALENKERESDPRFLEILMRPWSKEPVTNGVACKPIPQVFSENLCRMVEHCWGELPMFSRDKLIGKSMDGRNPHLVTVLERIKIREA